MVASARAAHVARTAGRLGVRTGRIKVDLAAVVDRKDAMVQEWRSGVRQRLEKAGDKLSLVREPARFTGPRTLSVGNDTHSADHVIINAGCRPVVPTLDGLDTVPWYDNDRSMDLRELPKHLVIVGGGYIGCEFGQMFRRFGARVTIIDHNDHLLSREDPDISEVLEGVFAEEGITLRLGSPVRTVRQDEKGLAVTLASRRKVRGSHLLVATGRRPNTDSLGCDTAGITLDERGFIPVDDHYCTSVEGVYAVGDVTGGPQFTHSSWDDHRILFDLLTGRSLRTRTDRLVSATVFTDPQVATVGLTERQARREGIPFELATLPWKSIARARETDQTAGLVKVLVQPEDERILGASIAGVEAGEFIHVMVAVI
jgi:pyruvate/2-oxoglutarate dehydrogenase complex dihydrolipoamide dehydrogenase (E3) component